MVYCAVTTDIIYLFIGGLLGESSEGKYDHMGLHSALVAVVLVLALPSPIAQQDDPGVFIALSNHGLEHLASLVPFVVGPELQRLQFPEIRHDKGFKLLVTDMSISSFHCNNCARLGFLKEATGVQLNMSL